MRPGPIGSSPFSSRLLAGGKERVGGGRSTSATPAFGRGTVLVGIIGGGRFGPVDPAEGSPGEASPGEGSPEEGSPGEADLLIDCSAAIPGPPAIPGGI